MNFPIRDSEFLTIIEFQAHDDPIDAINHVVIIKLSTQEQVELIGETEYCYVFTTERGRTHVQQCTKQKENRMDSWFKEKGCWFSSSKWKNFYMREELQFWQIQKFRSSVHPSAIIYNAAYQAGCFRCVMTSCCDELNTAKVVYSEFISYGSDDLG
ncbi:hypothetical protein Tco_1101935 [Tanacetum coccineum]